MIADEAVEAAAKAHAENGGGPHWEDWEQDAKDEAIADMRAALHAAAPHMLADAWESGWANARGNYTALYTGQDIPEWVTLRNPYGSRDDQS